MLSCFSAFEGGLCRAFRGLFACKGRLDAGVLSSGQVAGVIDDIPSVAELIARIMTEAQQTLKHLGELT